MKHIINFILLLILIGITFLGVIFDIPSLGKFLYYYNINIAIGIQKVFEMSIDFLNLPSLFNLLFIKLLNISLAIYGCIIITLTLILYNIRGKK
jgi:hypothetical protein|tara:strand:- start:3014 stop:3295 length:282 start_codon:yes stop_codon:yes gene_type:complete